VISDKYLSATVVYQKKDCGSHFFSYFLHVILSIPTPAATDVAATADRFPSTFFLSPPSVFLLRSSTCPQPPSADGFRTPGAPLSGFPVLLDTG
jgi:hypothetical protein